MKPVFILLAVCGSLALRAQATDPLEKERLLHQWNSGGHWEVSGMLGVANYQGDLADDLIEFRETKAVGGLLVRYHLNKYLDIRLGLLSGQVSGSDANSPRLADRGWRFDAILTELTVGGEFMFLPRDRFNNAGVFVPHFTPYFYTSFGVGFSRVNLRGPQQNEQNFEPFPRVGDTEQFAVLPFGVGLRLDLGEVLVLGAEVGTRAAFSDRLDGVATTNAVNRNDWYLLLGGTLGYYFSRHRD